MQEGNACQFIYILLIKSDTELTGKNQTGDIIGHKALSLKVGASGASEGFPFRLAVLISCFLALTVTTACCQGTYLLISSVYLHGIAF